jgi:hypothetical protein
VLLQLACAAGHLDQAGVPFVGAGKPAAITPERQNPAVHVDDHTNQRQGNTPL